MRRRGLGAMIASAAVCAVAVAVPASASAHHARDAGDRMHLGDRSKVVVHFYGTNETFTLSDAQGHVLPTTTAPVAGDTFVTTANLAYGNHLRHSAKQVGTAQLNCTVVSADRALCNGLININMIAPAEQYTVSATRVYVSLKTFIVPLTSGTGRAAPLKRGFVINKTIDATTSDFTLVAFA